MSEHIERLVGLAERFVAAVERLAHAAEVATASTEEDLAAMKRREQGYDEAEAAAKAAGQKTFYFRHRLRQVRS